MNWSTDETSRSAFFRVDWPVWRTAPSCVPAWSKTEYSFESSMIFVF